MRFIGGSLLLCLMWGSTVTLTSPPLSWLLGYRMACPQRCPDDVHKVMQRCWQYNPEDRPKFSELQRDLAAIKKKWWHKNTNRRHQKQVMTSSHTSPPSRRRYGVIAHLTAINKWWRHQSQRDNKSSVIFLIREVFPFVMFVWRWAWSGCGRVFSKIKAML